MREWIVHMWDMEQMNESIQVSKVIQLGIVFSPVVFKRNQSGKHTEREKLSQSQKLKVNSTSNAGTLFANPIGFHSENRERKGVERRRA